MNNDPDNPAALDELATLRGRPVLYLNGDIDANSLDRVYSAIPQLEDFNELSVLLVSDGGDPETTYRMVLALRQAVEDIEVLVPCYAKSAATFFCLAADSIKMGRYGELGPLDPQVLDLGGSEYPISSLETFKALEHLLDHSLESLSGIVELMRELSEMDVPNAIESSHPFFAAIAESLYSQVDPHELGESGRYLSESEEYAIRVMERWGYADKEEEDRLEIVRRLVWDYPTHGFVIDLTEAKGMGLKAEPMDADLDEVCRTIAGDDALRDRIVGIPISGGHPTVRDGRSVRSLGDVLK